MLLLTIGQRASVLFALEKCQLALKFRVARKTSRIERAFRHGGFHRATWCVLVVPVSEPADRREARDVAEGLLESRVLVIAPELNLAESRSVDEERAAREAE